MKAYLGEFLGTFILVLIGCGTVAEAVLFDRLNLYGVAFFFGMGVTTAIYASRSMCLAHLNPAVSFAFFLRKELTFGNFLLISGAQFLGAISAGIVLYSIFNPFIGEYEYLHGITRGEPSSYHSALMFGEYYPNPGFENELSVSMSAAMLWEALGTFILMIVIFHVGQIEKSIKLPTPLIIGFTVSLLIVMIAPYTQGGFNPARDFGPRLVAFFGGWEAAALPKEELGVFTVYILGPMIGSFSAHIISKKGIIWQPKN